MSQGFILDHTPQYWLERTREEITEEGYNAPYIAEELGKMNLYLKGEGPESFKTGDLAQE